MSETPIPLHIEALQRLIKAYETPEAERDAEQALLVLADLVRMIRARMGTSDDFLNKSTPHISAIMSGMRDHLNVMIEQMIGRATFPELQSRQDELSVHQSRIAILDKPWDAGKNMNSLLRPVGK